MPEVLEKLAGAWVPLVVVFGVAAIGWVAWLTRRRPRRAPRDAAVMGTSPYASALADELDADTSWPPAPERIADRSGLDARLGQAAQMPWQDPHDQPWDRP